MKPKSPIRQVSELLEELKVVDPAGLDLERFAAHLNVKIRYERLDRCAANITGLGDRGIITVDHNATPSRIRFSIAHELGHWLYDRGKVLLCDTQDLNIPWNERSRAKSIERRANQFAAELLMPRSLFRAQARNRDMSFASVERLRNVFGTSRTATAIRLVELGQCMGMLIMFDASGRRIWYCASAELPEKFYPHKVVPRRSLVSKEITQLKKVISSENEVDGDLWIEHPRAFDLTLIEQGMRVGKNLLVMISMTDESMISEIVDEELGPG